MRISELLGLIFCLIFVAALFAISIALLSAGSVWLGLLLLATTSPFWGAMLYETYKMWRNK